MSRIVHFDTYGNEIYEENKEEQMKTEKEKQMVTRYKQALYHAACDFARTKTNCGKCRCKDSCGCNPGTLGCRFALEDRWKQDAGIKDNHGAGDAPTYAQERLTDIEAIDVIEAWGLGFSLESRD